MKKLVFVLISLLLAASLAAAAEESDILGDGLEPAEGAAVLQEDDSMNGNGMDDGTDETEVDETDTDVGDDLVEEEVQSPAVVRNAITRLHVVGTGLAIAEEDAFDMMHAKIIIGAVKVRATEDDNTSLDFAVRRLGVLRLDNRTYNLRDIAVNLEELSAEVYDPTTSTNTDSVGEITVKRFEKPGQDIWAGNLVLNGKAYNVYFLGVRRSFTLSEVAQKIGDYCGQNPDDAKCLRIRANCQDDSEDCGERVREYCEANTSDMSCLQLKKQYCLRNATDERCREYLEGLCERSSDQGFCTVTTVSGSRVVSINREGTSEVTPEAGESETTLVSAKDRPKLQVVARNISSVRPTAATGR